MSARSATDAQLLWPPEPPHGDEGLLAFVTRCAADQFIASQHLIMRQAGQVHANRPTARLNGDLDVARLAHCLMVEQIEIERRNYPKVGDGGRLSFFGAHVPAWHVWSMTRRFSPASLREAPYGRGGWEHALIPFCSQSWEYLMERCPDPTCRAVQGWRHTTGFENCDRCGGPLADAARRTVPEKWRSALSFVAGLVSACPSAAEEAEARLPPELEGMNRGEVFELVLRLFPLCGHKELSNRTTRWWRKRPFRLSAALAEAGEMVLGWPHAVADAVARNIGRRTGRNRNSLHRKACTFFAARWAPEGSMMARVVKQLALANQADGPGRESCSATSLSITVVARRLGNGTALIAEARRMGALKTSLMLRGSELVPAFCREEIDMVEDLLGHRMAPWECATLFGIPGYSVEHMAELGELEHEDHPYLATRHPLWPYLDERKVATYVSAFQAGAIDATELADPIPLTSMMKGFGGRLKPWASALSAMRAGVVRYALMPEAAPLAQRIMVSADQRDLIVALPSPLTSQSAEGGPRMLTRGDALEVLNQSYKLYPFLAPYEQKPTSRDRRILSAAMIVAIGTELIAASEIEARYGLKAPAMAHLFKRVGLERRLGLGWPRAAAVEHLERL